MADTNKTEVEIVTSKPVADNNERVEYGKLIVQIKKSKEKISHDVEIADMRELVVRNTAELLALRAIRDKRTHDKVSKTQLLMKKFKTVL